MPDVLRAIIILDDSGAERRVDYLEGADPFVEKHLDSIIELHAILQAIRVMMDTPQGGSVIAQAALVSRRAKDWMKHIRSDFPGPNNA